MNYRGGNAERHSHNGRAAETVDNVICFSHADDIDEIATPLQALIDISSIESAPASAHSYAMLSTKELLTLLEEKQIKGRAIAQCLGLDPASVTRLFSGTRQLKLDEAKKLVEEFGLSPVSHPAPSPVSIPVARLLVIYAVDSLGYQIDPEDPRVEEIARDFQAFSKFAADPRIRESDAAVEGFLRGVRLGRGSAA